MVQTWMRWWRFFRTKYVNCSHLQSRSPTLSFSPFVSSTLHADSQMNKSYPIYLVSPNLDLAFMTVSLLTPLPSPSLTLNQERVNVHRFLIARRGDISLAAEMMTNSIQWRQKNLPATLETIGGALECNCLFVGKPALDGTATIYFRSGLFDSRHTPSEQFVLCAGKERNDIFTQYMCVYVCMCVYVWV